MSVCVAGSPWRNFKLAVIRFFKVIFQYSGRVRVRCRHRQCLLRPAGCVAMLASCTAPDRYEFHTYSKITVVDS